MDIPSHSFSFNMNQPNVSQKAISQFYQCECGKRYDAFPALYLHFKRKHNKKISSNPTPHSIRVRTKHYCKIITYLYTQTGLSNQNEELKIDENFTRKLKIVLDDFMRSQDFQGIEKLTVDKTIQGFYGYLVENISEQTGNLESKFYEKLPFRFNNFYLKLHRSDDLKGEILNEWMNIFINLGKWLKKRGYTDLTVVQNRNFKPRRHYQ